MGKLKLVLVGNGMAGIRCIEEIIQLSPDKFEITVLGNEPHPNYNRIMLSKVLQGGISVEDITINDWQWYKDHNIKLYLNETVIKIDTKRQMIITESGQGVEYDHLILATGSSSFMLPLPGANKPGVTAFRNINDCLNMVETSKEYKKGVVIGGGLLGLEAARGLLNLGMEVHVVHNFKYLMNRQLDRTAAEMLKKDLERQGMRFLLEKHSEKIIGKKRVEGLQFVDGTKIAADLVVMAVGVKPNIQLVSGSGIETDRAIVVNDFMETNVPNVYAVGECAEHHGMVYGLVAPLYEQGKVLARKICGMAVEGYQGTVLSSQLKVSGIEVFSAGEILDEEGTTSLQVFDGIRNKYKKVIVRDNKIVGAVLYGDSSEGNKLLGYIKQQADVSVLDQKAEAAGANDAYVCSMSDKETVCSCNGVSKGAILEVVWDRGLETFEQVRDCTKASSSCGGCKPMVSAILQLALTSEKESQAEKDALCTCTMLSHDEVKEVIQTGVFTSTGEVMQQLGWERAGGCATCQPALQYYIGSIHVKDGRGLASSLLADGTYSVVPRMYGGLTSAAQLRRIADVIDKYSIPVIKLSAAARLDLLGVMPSDVKSVTAELDMPLVLQSHGKPVMSVITCEGAGYDANAMQDSIRMGAVIERRLEHLQIPSAITIAVSGSPLHRAGTLTKDVGIVGTPGGWEIYIGGSGNAQLRQGQLLCSEETEEGTLDKVAAFVQWYREDAYYGEMTGQWLDRLGLVQLREGLFHNPFRRGLIERMEVELTATMPEFKKSWPTAALTR